MAIPRPVLDPMEARAVETPPTGPEWQYEPKWDGFRCIAFKERGKVFLQSKSGQPLARYFPELVELLGSLAPRSFVLDSEIVVPVAGRLSFDDLLMRVHPAASRVRKLASEHPAVLVVFDLLATQSGESLLEIPLRERRRRLEAFSAGHFPAGGRVRLSPATTSLKTALGWFKSVGGDLDGIIAKRLDLGYRAGARDGMQKVKHRRTADCVVGGFRYAQGTTLVGSLLLGLYDDEGKLNHVGFTSSFRRAERPKLTRLMKGITGGEGFSGRAPGGPSRWSTRRSDQWRPVRPELVVEVVYDHFTGGRFRHGTTLVRWRPDKLPGACTFDQVDQGKPGRGLLKLLDTGQPRKPARGKLRATPKRTRK